MLQSSSEYTFSLFQVLPEPKFPPRNPELEARIQRLKAEQAEREYKRMTSNVDGRQGLSKEMEQPFGKQMTELNNYLLLILQFVITVACRSVTYFSFLLGIEHIIKQNLAYAQSEYLGTFPAIASEESADLALFI